MILTITLSPTFDLTYRVDQIKSHAVNRVGKKSFEPSGKGINVSLNLKSQGFETIAISPISRSSLAKNWKTALSETVRIETSFSDQEIRINTSIVDSQGVTKINEEFVELSESEINSLIEVISNTSKECNPSWIALCGSVHQANAPILGAALRKICDQTNSKLAIDTSGASAQTFFEFKPDFIKPNREELVDWYPSSALSEDAYIQSICDLARLIDGTVLCTDGEAVAYATDNKNLLEIVPSAIAGANSVGAGDASLAGYLAAVSSGSDFVTSVKMAMKWAIASCLNTGTAGLNIQAASELNASVQELVRK